MTAVRVLAGAALVMAVAAVGALLWLALAHAEWSSSRSSGGQVNAQPAAGPSVTTIAIDVKPGSHPNSTNLGSRGVIPVAILTTPDFDAASVDPTTVVFEGASPVHDALEDVDNDSDQDVIMHFRTRDADIAEDATEACLVGETFSGQPLEGCDVIRIVPPWLDTDGDGFGDAAEATIGTDQSAACPIGLDHDAWPADMAAAEGIGKHDGTVNILDIVQITPPAFGTSLPDPDYSIRKDFNGDGTINILDIVRLTPPVFGQSCT